MGKIILTIMIIIITTGTATAKPTQKDIIEQACDCYYNGDNCGYTKEMTVFCEEQGV